MYRRFASGKIGTARHGLTLPINISGPTRGSPHAERTRVSRVVSRPFAVALHAAHVTTEMSTYSSHINPADNSTKFSSKRSSLSLISMREIMNRKGTRCHFGEIDIYRYVKDSPLAF